MPTIALGCAKLGVGRTRQQGRLIQGPVRIWTRCLARVAVEAPAASERPRRGAGPYCVHGLCVGTGSWRIRGLA